MKGIVALSAMVSLMSSAALAEENFRCRDVGKEWVWFEDHVAVYVSYATKGPVGRTYEVGTGISVSGSPWGKRKKYSGEAEFNAYGAGALHIRQRDEGSSFEVCATGNGLGTIPIHRGNF